MAISRNSFVKKIRGGRYFGTSLASTIIFNAVENGNLSYTVIETREKQRLDHLSGSVYGDSSYWWIIAAASGIGWGLQIPPGTIIRIPVNLKEVFNIL
tara:strand:+ start:5119 stop:5412 length:294 start_codon:yes stop_codon:yes gene_type:complete